MADQEAQVTLIAYMILGGFTSAVIETILAWRWVQGYFRYGIPIFRIRAQSHANPRYANLIPDLSQAFRSRYLPDIEFCAFSDQEIGFRERLLTFRLITYTPLMRGLINVDPLSRDVVMTGHLNWSIIVGIVVFARLFTLQGVEVEGQRILFSLMGVILASIYIIQAVRYRRVFRYIQSAHTTAA